MRPLLIILFNCLLLVACKNSANSKYNNITDTIPRINNFANQDSSLLEDLFISYQVDVKKQALKLYWKDDKDQIFKSILNLKNWLDTKKQKLVFAMNAGMYQTDNASLGLFIQDQKIISPLNTRSAAGNFYMKPNGVFYITVNNEPAICKTENFPTVKGIKYATQSGPMLVVNGKINSVFKQNSLNLNIRNGVGILPNKNWYLRCLKKKLIL